jgi:hypothetical protein
MTRSYFHRLSVLAICGTLAAASLASAGDKKGFSMSARRSLSSSNSSSQGMKLSTNSAFKFSQNSNSMNQVAKKNLGSLRPGSLSGASTNLANTLKKNGLSPTSRKLNLNSNNLSNLSSLTQHNKLITDRARLADIVKNGGLKPIGGIGTGGSGGADQGAGSGNFPGRDIIVDRGRIADIIKDGGLKPIGPDGPIVDNPPVADPGNNPPANPPADPPADPTPCPPKNDCHDHFPWWPIVVGGGYNWCHTTYPVYGGVTVVERPVVQTVVAAPPVQAAAGADLEVVDVRLVDAGDASRKLGPRYRLFLANRGTLAAGNFQAVILATKDAQPAADAPTASAEVVELAAGETVSVDMRLPLSADLSTLPVLIAAVDSVLQVAELDEANNAVALDRAKVAMAQ